MIKSILIITLLALQIQSAIRVVWVLVSAALICN